MKILRYFICAFVLFAGISILLYRIKIDGIYAVSMTGVAINMILFSIGLFVRR